MYLGRNITYECMNACRVSQSVIHHGVFKRKSLMEKIKLEAATRGVL